MFSFKKIWKHLWPEMRKHKLALFLVFAGYALGVIVDSIFKPLIFKGIIDLISSGSPTPEILSSIFHLILLSVFIIIVYNIGYRTGNYAETYFSSNVMRNLYNTTFTKLINHSYSFFSNTFSGSLVAKTKRLVKSFDTFFEIISWQIWFSVVTFLGIVVVLFIKIPILAIIFILWAIIYLFVTSLFIKKKIRLDMDEASADTKVTSTLADSITNILNIKIFKNSNFEKDNFFKDTEDEENKRRKDWNFGNFQNLVQSIMMGILQIATWIVLVKLWYKGNISVGLVVLVQVYIFNLFDILWGLGRNLTKLMQTLSEMVEITDILDQTPDILDPENPEELRIKNGNIKFENVTFEYLEDKEVFSNFNLEIKPGERIGLVGHSGSGKSTITKLLLRFADIKSGEINIDGQNIRNITQDDLRSTISYVPQEPILFHRTIRENIAYARPEASEEEIIEAAKSAHAHDFITGLQNGYDTLVGERGVKLSGGERQRVAIARAMLKHSPILILDEATSSLDSLSESYIQDAFNKLMENKTTIVIAHRLSTIQKMDRIIVLNHGAIAEEGTHKELLKKKGIYAELWDHQSGGFIE